MVAQERRGAVGPRLALQHRPKRLCLRLARREEQDLARLAQRPQAGRQRLARDRFEVATEVAGRVLAGRLVKPHAANPRLRAASRARRTRRARRARSRAPRGRSAPRRAAPGGARTRRPDRPPSRRARGRSPKSHARELAARGRRGSFARRRGRAPGTRRAGRASLPRARGCRRRAWARSASYIPSGVWPVGRISRRSGRARSRLATSSPARRATFRWWPSTSGVAVAILARAYIRAASASEMGGGLPCEGRQPRGPMKFLRRISTRQLLALCAAVVVFVVGATVVAFAMTGGGPKPPAEEAAGRDPRRALGAGRSGRQRSHPVHERPRRRRRRPGLRPAAERRQRSPLGLGPRPAPARAPVRHLGSLRGRRHPAARQPAPRHRLRRFVEHGV